MHRVFIYCYLLYHVKYVDYEVIYCVYILCTYQFINIYTNNVDIYTHILYIFKLCEYKNIYVDIANMYDIYIVMNIGILCINI